ncbi:unnamed protein product [Prorocentrum cordatum]|uniref:Uncharacterized protein n=1 Tax=Prorocentrum cordatum TaxID=2364126 RepID=A0ABN9S436_9DINO|nr:unnamed protein product [Polarella glacialis]
MHSAPYVAAKKTGLAAALNVTASDVNITDFTITDLPDRRFTPLARQLSALVSVTTSFTVAIAGMNSADSLSAALAAAGNATEAETNAALAAADWSGEPVLTAPPVLSGTAMGAAASTAGVTSAPTPVPVVIGASMGAVAGTGDPHLQNIYGERFDLMQAGRHVLVHIPRGARSEGTLLRVDAQAERLGELCADIYFQELNITGKWVEAQQALARQGAPPPYCKVHTCRGRVQLQTQGADTMDRRVTELKHQFEEELRQRLGELEGSQMETLSKVRASTAAAEDTLKRHELGIRRLETTLQDVLRKGDLWSHQAAMHHERLELLESMPRSRATASSHSEQEISAQVWQLEGRIGDIAKQLDQLNSDLRNDRETYHSMAAQIQEYDTRISACRSKVDGHHETLSGLDEHIRQGCEEKFEVLHKSFQELNKRNLDLQERHNAVKASVDYLQAGAMGLPPQAGTAGVLSPHAHSVAVEIAPDVWGAVDRARGMPATVHRGRLHGRDAGGSVPRAAP